ncbi:MAG TPA: amidohydrolase family protein [Gemmatimonadales bacterium]|nr:amidohydrolase family protein [Gemmatimonadales bacterium]
MKPLLCLGLLFVMAAPRQAPAPALVITNGSIIDPTGRTPVTRATVVVERGRITAIGVNPAIPPVARVVDARGRFLVPGLWDMHAHLSAPNPVDNSPERYVGYGVLGVRDMGGYADTLFRLRGQIRSGDRIGPEIVMAGPTLNGEQSGSWHRVVATDAEARAAVRELRAFGVDFIKVHRAMSRKAFLAVVDESRRAGLTVSGHVPLALSWIEASNLGMRTIEHIQTVFENEQPDPKLLGAQFAAIDTRLSGPHGDSIWAVLKRNHTFFDPTLVGYEANLDKAGPEAATRRRAAYARMKLLAARIVKAGVPILAGTDVLERQGDMLLLELERLVEIGMTPRQALAAATTTATEAVLHHGSGRIEVGAPAMFLILDANPLHDIRNLRALSSVVLSGRLIESAELARLRNLP